MAPHLSPLRVMALAVLLMAGLLPVTYAAEPRATGWVLTRRAAVAAPIEGTLTGSGVSEESAVVTFATTGSGVRRRLDYRYGTGISEWGVDGWAQVNHDPVPAPACPAAVCENPAGIRQTVYVSSHGRAIVSTVYIAAFDVRDPTLTITSPGWFVRRWQPGWRSVTTADAEGSMVSAAHTSVGTYRGAELRGGRYGSFVFAGLPCSIRGDGYGVLTGGTRRWALACDQARDAVDAAPGRTTWNVTGEVTGVGWLTAVLIVVDFPR